VKLIMRTTGVPGHSTVSTSADNQRNQTSQLLAAFRFRAVSPAIAQGYDDALIEERFARRVGFGGFTGAGVDDGASTTRGDENVRTP
jgi:hypothetical protein